MIEEVKVRTKGRRMKIRKGGKERKNRSVYRKRK